MSASSQTSYDVVPYPGYPRPQSHPDCLGTRGRMFGLSPRAIDECRVLELGCADGGNLIPIAFSLPGSRCLGIDLSARQIRDGQKIIEANGLQNIELRQMSILDVDESLGEFDYIISHGVFSWVPPEVQAKILAICRDHLTANGVAFISYNTYPGWHLREMTRDLMLYHTRMATDPARRMVGARQILDAVIQASPSKESAYCKFLQEEQQLLQRTGDSYLFHEHLEENNRPMYFHQFYEMASAHSLQFLCEAEVASMGIGRYPQELANVTGIPDIVAREQYLDFLMHRMFRQTLLCREDVPVVHNLQAKHLAGLWLSSPTRSLAETPNVQSMELEVFGGPGGLNVNIGHPLSKAALTKLGSVWPARIRFEDLLDEARRMVQGEASAAPSDEVIEQDNAILAETLLAAFSGNIVQLHMQAAKYTTELADNPKANSLGRWQASMGHAVTTLRHESRTYDVLTNHLIAHLDGEHTRDQLLDLLQQFLKDNDMGMNQDGQLVTDPTALRELMSVELEGNLRDFAELGLLVD